MSLGLRILLFFLIILMGSIECKKEVKKAKKKPMDYKIVDGYVICDPKFWTYCDYGLSPGSKSQAYDFKGHLSANITSGLHTLMILFTKKNKKEKEWRPIFTYDFDMCQLTVKFMTQTIASPWIQNMKRFTNVPVTCPILEGDYYARRLKFSKKTVPLIVVSGFYNLFNHYYVAEGSKRYFVGNASVVMQIDL